MQSIRRLLALLLPLAFCSVSAIFYWDHLTALTTLANAFTFGLEASVELGDNDGWHYPEDFLGPERLEVDAQSAVVPAIFHGILLGGLEMRPQWVTAREDCRRLHPEAKFVMWTDENSTAFVATYYPEVFGAYQSYRQTIQRTNVLRYLLLHHFGGIYLDWDIACRTSLDPLRRFHLVTSPTTPVGISNAFIAASPDHPLFTYLISQINRFNLHWPIAYFENTASTGSLFFSVMHLRLSPHLRQTITKVLPGYQNRLNGHVVTPFFEHLGASSCADSRGILALGQFIEVVVESPILSYALSFLIVFVVAVCVWLVRLLKSRSASLAAASSGIKVMKASDVEAEKLAEAIRRESMSSQSWQGTNKRPLERMYAPFPYLTSPISSPSDRLVHDTEFMV